MFLLILWPVAIVLLALLWRRIKRHRKDIDREEIALDESEAFYHKDLS